MNNILIEDFCTSFDEILSSQLFLDIINSFLKTKNCEINNLNGTEILTYYKDLINKKDVKEIKGFSSFTEALYDYYRKINRFSLLKNIDSSEMIKKHNDFTDLVLLFYRTIHQRLTNNDYLVYRELPAGTNATFIYEKSRTIKYLKAYAPNTINRLLFRPPYIIESLSNTRTKQFNIINNFPTININETLNYHLYIGNYIASILIEKNKIGYLVALSNLFEAVPNDILISRKINIVVVYAQTSNDCSIYFDKRNNVIYGFLENNAENDYFGYLKKLLLTCHNILNINQGFLPVHGAGVNIKIKDKETTIVIIGDSGAGKSETLEALKTIDKEIELDIIYDDMGTLEIINNDIFTSGTEIGAFVRLDDLEKSFAPLAMDRAIFINPKRINSRVVVPVSKYETIMTKHKVDIILYANNYSKINPILKRVFLPQEAYTLFKNGKRVAKGTTDEQGIVSTFFANPFGPLQKRKECQKLLKQYLELAYYQNLFIGELKTKLAIPLYERKGPKEAAQELYKLIKGE